MKKSNNLLQFLYGWIILLKARDHDKEQLAGIGVIVK